MAPRRPPAATPDLFVTPQDIGPAGSATPTTKNTSTPARYILPEGLALALRTMEDGEFDRLLASVTAEARRRGRLPREAEGERPKPATKPAPKPKTVENSRAVSLTTGQINAVRAAFRAGIKLSAIARQFGLLPAQVKKALEQG